MSRPPVFYDYQNWAESVSTPSTVKVTNTALSRYFARYLLQKTMSVFTWNLPTHWAEDYFKYVLYCIGYISIVNTDKYGVICQQCSLKGFDIFYRPTNAVITNPLIKRTLEPRIGIQCTIMKLQPDYGGVMDIVNYYADMMALVATAIGVTALNTKNAFIFAAEDDKIAQSMKKMYDRLASGEPAVVVNKKLFNDNGDGIKMQLFGKEGSHIDINELLLALQTIENNFARDIGLPVLPSARKERDLNSEVLNNQINATSRIAMWLQELQKDCKLTREMFGINISVDWRWEGGLNESDTITAGNV